jgi:RimJ/RimL family protein N-acetyltransferase
VRREDLPVLFEHQRDDAATRMADFPSRDREAFFAHWERILAEESGPVRAIEADGELAGNIVCWKQGKETLVGYWLGREHWGRGIATQALRAFLALVETRPLRAYVARHNVASVRVLEKCGFTMVEKGPGEVVGTLV